MAHGAARRRRLAGACLMLALCTANAVAAQKAGDVYIEDTDRFPGWKGELPRAVEVEEAPNTIGYGEGGVVRLLTHPRRS